MNSRAARLAVHLDLDDKARVTHAAALLGISVSAFVREAALREADTAMSVELITLSAKESRRLLAGLDKPFKPTGCLKKAMADSAKLTRKR